MKKEKRSQDFLHKPYYEGGIKAMRRFIKEQLQYPEAAKKERIEGTVHLRYTIDYQGRVIDAKVISGLGYGCDEEAIRVVKLLQFAIEKNRKRRLRFHKKIQVHFRLPKAVSAKADSPVTPVTPATTIEYHYTTPKKQQERKDKPGSYSYSIDWG